MILNSLGVKHHGKEITHDTIAKEMTPAQLNMYLTAANNIDKQKSLYSYYASAMGFNGVPDSVESYEEAINLALKHKKRDVEMMDDEEFRRYNNRKNMFGRWYTKGWNGDSVDPKNALKILKFSIFKLDDPNRFLSGDQINELKQGLTTEEIDKLEKILEREEKLRKIRTNT